MSVESFGFKFVVDAKDAAKGYGDFQRAVDGVFASMQRFEQQAKKSLDAVTASSKRGQSDIAKYAAQFKALQSIPIDGTAAPKLLKLADAMARFKAPNTTQISNMRGFFNSLSKLPDLSATTRSITNIAKLSAAMNGFKAPSASQATKLVEFAKALQTVGPGLASLSRVSGVSGIANELASVSIALGKLKIPSAGQANNLKEFSRALQMMRLGGAGNASGMLESLSRMNGFKAPTQAQTRNLQAFVNAVNNLKVPENAGRISAYLMQIAEAAQRANGSLQGFRGSLNSLGYGMRNIPWTGFSGGAHKARLEMMGLQNAFSGTFQVGSLLRSVLGSLTIGELGREFFTAVQSANQFHAAMEVLGQTPMMQSKEWERVRADANHFGQDLITFSDGFSKFAVAAHESGMELGESFKVWEGFSTVMSAMHLGQEQQQSVGLAIREIMDQGYVSTQRLTRQLGLVLPGSLATLQKAWAESGKKGVNFFDALKKKMVDGKWALDTLAAHYKEVYGPALKAALESPIQQFNILKNNVSELMIEIGNDGAKKAFADFIAKLSGGLDPSHMKAFAQGISDGLVKAIHRAGDAVEWLKNNWDSIKGPLATAVSLMGKWMVISAAFKIGATFVTPLLNARRVLSGFNGSLVGTEKTVGLLSTGFTNLGRGLQPLPTGLGRLNIGAMAATASMNTLRVAANGFKMVGSGLLNLVGGPLGIAMLGLGTIIAGTAGHIMSATIQVNDMHSSIDDAMNSIRSQNDALAAMAKDADAAGQGVAGAGIAAHGASDYIVRCGNDAQTAADKFFNLAMQARSAMLEMNMKQITDLENQKKTAVGSTAQGATRNYRDSLPTLLGGNGKGFTSWKDWYNKFTTMEGAKMAHSWDNGASDDALVKSAQDANVTIQKLYAQRARIMTANPKQLLAMKGDGPGDPPPVTDPLYKGVGSGGHHKKGPDLEKQLKEFQNQMSEIMDKLMDGDPVGKLTSTFINELTKQGQILLTNKSYHTFFENMKNDAAHGKVSVDSLINALQNGGIKGKALDDLKARYGTDVDGIIKLLRKEQAQYEDAVKEATSKAIHDQYKGVDDAIKKLAENNPLLKLQNDFQDTLEESAHKFLNPDTYKAWLTETMKDANGAATAFQRLVDALGDAKQLAKGLPEALAGRGLKPADLVGAVITDKRKNAFDVEKDARKNEFGAETIRQMQEEVNLGGLSNRQQEIANKLLSEYIKQRELGNTVSQQQLDHMQQEIGYWEKQIDLMQQMKEYYENNGIKKYIADVQTAGDFVHDFDNHALKNLEDTLYNLGTTGKLSFKSLLDGMQSDIIRFASQNLMKTFITKLMPGAMTDKDPTIGGIFGKMLGGTKGFTQTNKSIIEESLATPMNVNVVNGGLAFGGGAFAGGNGMLPSGGAGGGGLFDFSGGGAMSGLDDYAFSGSDLGTGGAGGATDFSSMFDATSPGSVGYSLTSGLKDAVTAAQPDITKTFQGSFKGIAGSMSTILGGALGSAIGGKNGGIIGSIAGMLLGGIGGGSGGSGGGGIMSMIMGLFGGGGGGGSMLSAGSMNFMDDTAMMLGFSEGGITGQGVGRQYRVPSSAFVNAPHYSEGTANTSGMPAVLHDNEAVIPLSRNRKVPVQLTNGNGGGNGPSQVVQNFNISSPDADSFRKSRTQIATELHSAGARSWARNNT